MVAVSCVLHHHIGTESIFEHDLNVTTDYTLYISQIDWLSKNFDFIDLSTLLSGRFPRRPLLLTFDDSFRSVMDVARNVLKPRGIPSVYFINPGLLGKSAVSLDSAIAWAAGQVGIERLCDAIGVQRKSSVGKILIEEMSAFGPDERAEITANVLTTFGPPNLDERAPLLDENDLQKLPGLGIDVGNHTMTHVHCRELSTRDIEREIVDAKARLEALSGARVRAFSIPYGNERDLTPNILKALRASGHEAIFLVHARSNLLRPAPDVWYRTSLHNEVPNELFKKIRIFPWIRSMKNFCIG